MKLSNSTLSRRAKNALMRNGITTLKELQDYMLDLKALPGIGKGMYTEIVAWMAGV